MTSHTKLCFRCGFVNEVSVRDGLVRVFFDRWDEDNVVDLSPPSANARRESAAVECTLFSVIAIGALMLGAPATVVSRHLNAAGRALAKLAGWKELAAVNALILHGLANSLLPAPRDRPGHEQEQQHCSSMDDAQAIHGELPVKNPFANAFLTFRATCENLAAFLPSTGESVDPVNISGSQDGGDRGTRAPWVQAAHPAYVTTDSECKALSCKEGEEQREGWDMFTVGFSWSVV